MVLRLDFSIGLTHNKKILRNIIIAKGDELGSTPVVTQHKNQKGDVRLQGWRYYPITSPSPCFRKHLMIIQPLFLTMTFKLSPFTVAFYIFIYSDIHNIQTNCLNIWFIHAPLSQFFLYWRFITFSTILAKV